MHPSSPSGSLLLTCIAATMIGPSVFAETVTYRLTVDNTWSEETHPGAFPPDAHFSWLGGGTHREPIRFWQVDELASPGMVQMAETGVTRILIEEVEAIIDVGLAGGTLDWQWWFCPVDTDHPSCGELVVEFDMTDEHPLVTLVSMLGPSPDWFIGVSGLPLRSEGQWLEEVVVDLHPYDGGTRSANVFELFGPLTDPPEPISVITEETGQIITPASLGTFTFTLLTPTCPADVTGDGAVGFDDVLALLGAWGNAGGPEDVDGSGTVDFGDLLVVLGAWGPCG